MTQISEHDAITGEIIVRDMTEIEAAEFEAETAAKAAEKQAQEQAAKDKATARAALLTKLGITADEAALLLA